MSVLKSAKVFDFHIDRSVIDRLISLDAENWNRRSDEKNILPCKTLHVVVCCLGPLIMCLDLLSLLVQMQSDHSFCALGELN